MTTTAIIAAGEARAAQVATMPRTQLIRGVDMDEAITWEEIDRPHEGSPNCPADARDVPCMVKAYGLWHGGISDGAKGITWDWSDVTAYRLPAITAPADPVRDALVASVTAAIEHLESLRGAKAAHMKIGLQFVATELRAALALAKGGKP